MFNHQKLRCYEMALGAAKRVPGIVAKWPKGTYYLEDQLKRAISSVLLNIAEGNARKGIPERARFFAIARASAAESASCIDVALALRLMTEPDAFYLQDQLLQVVKMLYKLR